MKIRSELLCRYSDTSKVFILKGHQTLGRPSKTSDPDLPLEVRSVSRNHGEFVTDEESCIYKDMGGVNGTIYNGKRMSPGAIRILKDGDVLRIHGMEDEERVLDVEMIYSEKADEEIAETEKSVLGWDNRLQPYQAPKKVVKESVESRQNRTFSGEGLEVHVLDRTVGRQNKRFTLLKDIHIHISNGSMVLILGGSGAGKTTLMNAIMGYEKANGTILYNGTDIYREYENMKYEIGYVPQQDLLRMNDTVFDTLVNAAKLRLPAGESDSYYDQAALETMELLGLKREKDSLVRKLSGGQRKRLSIAVEYVGNPALFFLDEPDSGLDGVMARELMTNLRTIADQGKIVIVITHSPDRAFELFDQVVVLAKDTRDNCGHLVFAGSPREGCEFFGVGDFESIVRKINREDEGGEGLAEHFIEKWEQSK